MSDCRDHDCFEAVAEVSAALSEASDRVGHFLYVSDNKTGVFDFHWRGNASFAGGAFVRLVESAVAGHEAGSCENCDRVVRALLAAHTLFASMTSGGSC